MTDVELQQVLDDKDAPNEPLKLPGLSGPRPNELMLQQVSQRRAAMTQALAQGVSVEAIQTMFVNQFGMRREQVRDLQREVRAMWDDDDAEFARYAKGAARRRIYGHIRKASAAGKFTAVAAFEKVMADIEGTNVVQEEKPTDVDARLTTAVLSVLGSLDTRAIRVIIEKERMVVELSARTGTPDLPKLGETVVIDAKT